jgi:arylformamidase
MSIGNEDSVNVSAFTMSTHCGTHTDAPHHFIDEAERLEEINLDAYLGPVTVYEIKDVEGPLKPKHLEKVKFGNTQRLIIKTQCSQLPDDQWPKSFVYPTPEAAEWMVDQGLWLFGTDAPTVDPVDSKTLDAHKVFYHGGVAILEGLQLKDVKPGKYELIALPLKLNVDGAPVRAVLRSGKP